MKQTKYSIDFGGLGKLLRCMDATPIRRHCCDICRKVFECHLCDLEIDHRIHGGGNPATAGGNGRVSAQKEPVFVCTDCIAKNDLNTVVLGVGFLEKRGGKPSNLGRFKANYDVSYYDHHTGEKIQ